MTIVSTRNGHVNGGGNITSHDQSATTTTKTENPYYVESNERIAIIGAGVAGIAMAAALRNANYTNFVVYDKQSNLGGLWLQNYPNIAGTSRLYFCNIVHSHLKDVLVSLTVNDVLFLRSLSRPSSFSANITTSV